MIGAFARMWNSGKRVSEVVQTEEDVAVHLRNEDGLTEPDAVRDAPPEAFVEKVPTEAGDVYLVPFLDSLRSWTRKMRKGEASEPARDR